MAVQERREDTRGQRWMRASVRILLATLVLACAETVWLGELRVELDPSRLVTLLAVLACLVFLAEAVVSVCWTVAWRLSPRFAPWIFTAFTAPLMVAAVESLFSGYQARRLPGLVAIKLAVVAGLVLGVRAAVGLYARVSSMEGHRLGARLWPLFLVGGLALAWIDTHVYVGLYPAFHFLLAAAVVYCADMFARILVPRARRLPVAVGLVPGLAVAAGVVLTVHGWQSPAQVQLVEYSDGLVPKFRRAVVLAAQPRSAMALDVGSRVARQLTGAASGEDTAWRGPDLLRDDRGRPRPWRVVGGARWTGLDAPDSFRLVLDEAGQAVELSLDAEALAGSRVRASVRVRKVSGGPGASVSLRLLDGEGREQAQAATVPVESAWTELLLRAEDIEPPAPATLTGELVLDPQQMHPNGGSACWVALPGAWAGRGDSLEALEHSSLVVLEDGLPLGPAHAPHDRIRAEGGGAFSHWKGGLYFSASDGSDPRSNGRRYEILDGAAAETVPAPRPFTLRLDAPLASPLPFEVLVSDARLVAEAHPADGPASLPDVVASRERLVTRAPEFRFRPSSSPAMEALREQVDHVVVVLIDALRADHLGRVVEGRSLTPHLDALVAQSVSFERFYSPSNRTGRSLPSLMTSYPLAVTLAAADLDVPLPTWLSLLRDRGLRTFHNGSNYVFRKYAHIPLEPSYGAEEQGTQDSKVEGLETEVLEFLRSAPDAPAAVFTHWSDPHVRRSKDMARTYQEAVTRADARLGVLVDGLRDAGLLERTLLVVTSDHGYSLGEENRYLASADLAERAVQVPCVIRAPGLAAPATVSAPHDGHALTATVLDVMAPDVVAATWSPSLFASVLGEQGIQPPTVFSSSGAVHMVRFGTSKFVGSDTRDTSLVFDLAGDPQEREAVFDPEALDRGRALLEESVERQGRLARAVVGAHRQELAHDVLTRLLASEVDPRDVRELLVHFWTYNGATRRYLLETLFRRDIDDVRKELERLERDGWTDDDQLLLVMRAWAGSLPAGRDLARRLPSLGPAGRRWLADLLPELPDDCVEDLAPELVPRLTDLWAARPEPGGADEQFVTLAATGLATALGEGTPPEIKALLCRIFEAWSVSDPGPAFETLRIRRFTRRDVLYAMKLSFTDDDLSLLASLPINRDVAVVVPELCLRLDSPASRAFLLGLIARWEVHDGTNGGISYMIPTLRRFHDEEFRREANRLIQSSYPSIWAFD